ncbi:MAG: hypothetical protein HY293_10475, partial [Planctomycetes bacterium]|nr:hypothetical protein [Planctomycetota bacterium]
LSPGAIADFMLLFHGKGYWGWGAAWYYDRAAVQGTWLVVWWLLEAILVFLVPSMFAGLFLSRHPPCRRCGNWLYMNEGARRVQSSRADRVFTGMKNGDLSPLEEPDRPQKGDPFTVRIDFIPCESCVGTFYVNLLHDRKVLLWMHPIPASEAQKVFKPVRASKKK